MFELTPQAMVFLAGVLVLTITAAYTDLRYFRIYNWLTLPAFALGWVYQLAFHGLPGLADAGMGFAIGFGLFFLLFVIGASGGGDTKLMAALSVWLGWKLTLYTIVLTILFVAIGSVVMLIWSVLRRGISKTREDIRASATKDENGKWRKSQTESLRRVGGLMAYAEPIALATWCVLFLDATVISAGQLKGRGEPAKAVAAPTADHTAKVESAMANHQELPENEVH
jgi:prepilin peptidase CpaA